jgi:hypothetical protein
MAFVHIPIYAARSFQQNGRGRTMNPCLNEESIGQQGDVCDSTGNNCKYSGADLPFMGALVETEGLMAVFSGHDHGVDWCMEWAKDLPDTSPSNGNGNGLNVCFNRHSGYGGYTNRARGARARSSSKRTCWTRKSWTLGSVWRMERFRVGFRSMLPSVQTNIRWWTSPRPHSLSQRG